MVTRQPGVSTGTTARPTCFRGWDGVKLAPPTELEPVTSGVSYLTDPKVTGGT